MEEGLRENLFSREYKSKEDKNKKRNEKLHRIAKLQARNFYSQPKNIKVLKRMRIILYRSFVGKK